MPTAGREKKYKRILLKLSGEELMGEEGFGIDPKVLDRMALEIGQLVGLLDPRIEFAQVHAA